MTLPCASRYMFSVAAAGAFSRKSMKWTSPVAVRRRRNPPPPMLPASGMDDGEREARGYCGINGVAAGLHDFDSGAGSELVDAGDDGVLRMRGAEGRGRETCSEQKCERADHQGEMNHFEVRCFEQGAHR